MSDIATKLITIDQNQQKIYDNAVRQMSDVISRRIRGFYDPTLTTVGQAAFYSCRHLEYVHLPSATSFETNAFAYCTSLMEVDTKSLVAIGQYAFNTCSNLDTLILRNEQVVCSLMAATAIPNLVYIYVPASLIDAYKTATNWSSKASYIRAIEDYTLDGTVTGQIDYSKV